MHPDVGVGVTMLSYYRQPIGTTAPANWNAPQLAYSIAFTTTLPDGRSVTFAVEPDRSMNLEWCAFDLATGIPTAPLTQRAAFCRFMCAFVEFLMTASGTSNPTKPNMATSSSMCRTPDGFCSWVPGFHANPRRWLVHRPVRSAGWLLVPNRFAHGAQRFRRRRGNPACRCEPRSRRRALDAVLDRGPHRAVWRASVSQLRLALWPLNNPPPSGAFACFVTTRQRSPGRSRR